MHIQRVWLIYALWFIFSLSTYFVFVINITKLSAPAGGGKSSCLLQRPPTEHAHRQRPGSGAGKQTSPPSSDAFSLPLRRSNRRSHVEDRDAEAAHQPAAHRGRRGDLRGVREDHRRVRGGDLPLQAGDRSPAPAAGPEQEAADLRAGQQRRLVNAGG